MLIETKKNLEMPEATNFRENLDLIRNKPLEFHEKNFKTYGNYVKTKLMPSIYAYCIYHPDGIQHILKENQKNYKKPDFLLKIFKVVFGNSIFTSEGDFWLKQRRLAQPAFHKKRIEGLLDTIVKATEVTIEEWNKLEDGTVIDISHEMLKLTIRSLSKSLFSIDISSDSDVLGKSLRDGFNFINHKMNNMFTLPLWFPNQRNKLAKEALKNIDEVVTKIISSRKEDKKEYNDLLAMLLHAKDDESNEGMSLKQLKDEVVTLLLAGHDTTSAALSWTFLLLAQNKDKNNKLLSEIDSILKDSTLTLEKVNQLEYTKMCFEEAMRLYPPAWSLPRETIHEDVVGGYKIPPKSTIILSQSIIHRHSDFWEKPNEFYPEHFEMEKVKNRHPFAYFPFGGGARMCIGFQFAMLEAEVILSMLLNKFELELVPNQNIIPDTTFTLIPKDGIKFILRKRK